ncbi:MULTISPECIES: hypothetical protein [Leptospira]|uniref:hypothetical protein n=1 Tax=Leptospira TaxID=171 RepID=UPI0005180F44|nr:MULTISPECIES: hypothetical protein [Leptospira]
MKNSLTLIRIPYEEPYQLNLVIEASNGHQAGELEFYDNAESLSLCAKALEAFPKNNKDEFSWELGSENPKDRFAFFFRFRVYLLDSSGHAALNLRLSNNLDHPIRALTDFSIQCEPAGLNSLGLLFKHFSKLEHEKLYWNGIDGEIT